MANKSMQNRLRRVAAKAKQKKQATHRNKRKALIERLAADVSSRSFEEMEGGAHDSADTHYDRKKNQPKTKGDDAKVDYDWEHGEGYPHDGTSDAGLGSGKPDMKAKKPKQKELDEAEEEHRKNTSDMEWSDKWDKRPRPKLSAAQKRQKRRKRIAELKKSLTKTAFNPEGDPEMKKMFSDMEKQDAPKKEAPRAKGVAPKEMRVNALKIQQFLSKALPRLQEMNSDLEMAVTGGKSGEILKLLSPMAKALGAITGRASALESALGQAMKMASANDNSLQKIVARHAQLEEEVSRSRTLVRLAAQHIRL